MNLPGGTMLRAAALLGASQLLSASLLAQATTNQPALGSYNSVAAAAVGSPPQAPAEMPPLLLPDRSPIAFFRELLSMDADELAQALAKYTPERQTQILAKVREYEALDPDDRALRLGVTELRWYLRPLMATSAAERADQLARIPEPNRSLLKARLSEWDKVPPDIQKELLGLEPTLQYFAEIEGRDELQRQQMLNSLSPSRRRMLEKGFQRWEAMSAEQRQRTLSRFKQFFDLTGPEKEKALKMLSEPERRQIEKTLRTFGNLSEEQRTRCVSSFEKFACLSLVERQEFLKNAERWKLMSPGERDAWRQLVNHLPPPPPPRPPPPPPPLPRYPPVPVAPTNRN